MSLRRGNPNFTKPEAMVPPRAFPTSFEEIVRSLGISPAEYETSTDLREWVRRNKAEKYVPTTLLTAFGFRTDSEDW
ncbi:MAG TPA: hypothetical protein VH088_09960 [Terriglobales bacterium]|jgi:hypothetical protein|nr:hypothetical protein [Terriglobales bacterium]